MRNKYIVLMMLMFLFQKVEAQDKILETSEQIKKDVYNLQIGDLVPDFKLAKIFNSAKGTGNISDYKDRLLILDFGNTRCSGCIAALPRMDSLQKMFGHQIQLFWVTYEPEVDIQKFWKRSKLTQNNALQTIVEDTLLSAHFKHRLWPHEVWIYKGKVIAITEPEYVDAKNIKKVLSGTAINWPIKNDFYAFDGNQEPLFKPDPVQIDTSVTMMNYAAVSDYKAAVNQERSIGIVRNTGKKTIRTFFANMPILNLYLYCFYNSSDLSALMKPSSTIDLNQIEWKVRDRSKFEYLNKSSSGYKQDWLMENGICFESMHPDKGQTDQVVYHRVIDDMNRLLGLNVHWGKRKEKVLVLVRTNKDTRWKSKSRIFNAAQPLTVKGTLHQFRHDYVGSITYNMNQVSGNPYVFDETGIKESIDLDLNFSSWKDIVGIRRSLNAYGLDLKEEERPVDKLVFAEANVKDGGILLIDAKMQAKALARKAKQPDLKNPDSLMNLHFLELNKKKTGVIVLPSGLQYKVLKNGNGPIPTRKDLVKVNYTGMLVNGKIFESSMESGKMPVFKVDEVIEGWTQALQLMPVGSKWVLYIPARLAYGEHSNSGRIPANSVLIFELELIQIEN